MTNKFKTGDRVRLVDARSMSAKVGATATVGPKGHFSHYVDIIWDRDDLSKHQCNGGYMPSSFELVVPANPFKVGDKVRCLRDVGGNSQFGLRGNVYEVIGVRDGLIQIKLPGYFHNYVEADRFEKVASPAFKVGDKVRVLPGIPTYWWFKPGHTGTIDSIRVGGDYVVKFDHKADTGILEASQLELYVETPKTDTKKTWIISLLESGKLKPAVNPATYRSEKQAHAVAKSMAEKHRGSTFVVFEATGVVTLPVVQAPEVVRL